MEKIAPAIVVIVRVTIRKMESEQCVLCGALTPYLRQDPIETRIGYVEGAGQLCKSCSSKY
jgi:hypothetical protein